MCCITINSWFTISKHPVGLMKTIICMYKKTKHCGRCTQFYMLPNKGKRLKIFQVILFRNKKVAKYIYDK